MILASQSPRRIALLAGAGLDFRVIPARIDETPLPGEDPFALVGRLSRAKARAVAAEHAAPGEVVLGADTIVTLDGAALGKPADAAAARAMLRALSGRTHQVATGVCLAKGPADPSPCSFVEVTEVEFRPLTDEEIAAYVATGEPMDKAGAYGIQGEGGRLVAAWHGDYDNVVGLPLARVLEALERL